ncbi:MAG: 4-(cytidine 5'-diphospho)-2-C-methyl-D-erythritol kinase [Terriglobales bacterium]|jgi:4-diphosphocytidyl-2-C-methyl-D-erythritol kinase
MPAVTVRSFAKINIGLAIGPRRRDGFHELRTVYQTISLSDTLKVDVQRGSGIEIRCRNSRVPCDETNTCWRIADRVMKLLKVRGKAIITLEKHLPLQGGLGGASANGVATMLALERVLENPLEPEQRMRMASEVGSDLPLFLLGGTILGAGRGEEVYPLEDLPPLHLVVANHPVGVSTPQAFADWDSQFGGQRKEEGEGDPRLTHSAGSATIGLFGQRVFSWLSARLPRAELGANTGVPAVSGSRAETPLLDLVRAGIENDFERVVFPKHPELREVKRGLERAGAKYASLSGSGSCVYGVFDTAEQSVDAAEKLAAAGGNAVVAGSLSREEYWRKMFEV